MSIMLTEGQDRHPHARAIRTKGQRIKRCDRRNLKRAFLRLYPRLETVKATCRHLGIARNTFYGWRQRDPAFSDRYYGMVNARFDAEMARIDRINERANDAEYWRSLPEGELIRAVKRMMTKQEREKFRG